MFEDRIIQDIIDAWQHDQDHLERGRRQRSIPDFDSVRVLIETAFLASLKREEDRSITFSLALLQRGVSDALARRHAPVGPDEIAGPHRPRYVPRGLEILHTDLPGGPVQASVFGRHHRRNACLRAGLLFHTAHSTPCLGQPMRAPPVADQSGGQCIIPEEPPAELQGLRGLQASTQQ